MRLIRWFCHALVLWLLVSGFTYAECFLQSNARTSPELFMDMGRVMVNPDTPPGTVVARRSWPLRDISQVYRCNGNNEFVARMVMPTSQDNGNRVFSTNIPGIGLRFTLKPQQGMSLLYTDKMTLNSANGNEVSMKEAIFTLEVVKTAVLSGSGPVTAGQYTTFSNNTSGQTLFTTWMRENSLLIVSPSCLVNNNTNFNVDMGSVALSAFRGMGSTAGGRSFSIKLQCAGGAGVSGTRVNMTFNGNLAENTNVSQGVLRNEQKGAHVASGIGVQILDNRRNPVEFRRSNQVATLTSEPSQFLDLRYFARFYQYLPVVTSGEVQAHLVFNINYD